MTRDLVMIIVLVVGTWITVKALRDDSWRIR